MSVRAKNSLKKIGEDVDQLSLPFFRCSLNPSPPSLGVHHCQDVSCSGKESLVCFALNYSGDEEKYKEAANQFNTRDEQSGDVYTYKEMEDIDRDTLRLFALRHYTEYAPVVGVGTRDNNDYNIDHNFKSNLFPDQTKEQSDQAPCFSFDVGLLDWFFMQPHYFGTDYGMNWPSKLSSAFKKNQIKKYFFFPITCYTSAEVQNMFRIDYKRYTAKKWNFEEFGLRCELLDWNKSIMYNPLVYATHQVDDWLQLVDVNKTSFIDQMDLYVNKEHPFLMISKMNETSTPSEVCDSTTADKIHQQLEKKFTLHDASRGTTTGFTLSTDNVDSTNFKTFLEEAKKKYGQLDHKAVKVRSAQHGKGLFATKDINQGALLCLYTGTYLPCDTFRKLGLGEESKSHALQVAIEREPSMAIDGRTFTHFYESDQLKDYDWAGGAYMNSSEEHANAKVHNRDGGQQRIAGKYGHAWVKVTALIDIKTDQEILWEYAYKDKTTNTYLSPYLLEETIEPSPEETKPKKRAKLIPTGTINPQGTS